MTPDAEPRLTRASAFHPRTSLLTRNFTEYRGFWLPACYTGEGPIAEYWACREKAAVMDLSALRKFEVTGPDAEVLLQRTATRDIRKLTVGQVVYTALCYDSGGMLDDATIFRLGPANFRVVCGEEFTGKWLRDKVAEWGLKAWVKSSTDQLHNIAVQGPLSREILAPLIWTGPTQPAIAELKWFRFSIGRLGGPQGPALVVSRTGYTGELGFEVWCHPKDAAALWDAVWAEGAPKGMKPLGLSALDLLRVEAGLVFAGYDFCDQTDPFEAGIGFTVAAKEEDFVGKAALERRKANPARKLVGLLVASNEDVGHGDPVHVGRAQVGVVTSAAKSPILKAQIALARLDVSAAEEGAEVEIGKLDGQRKRLPARIVPFPHFDPQKTRVRA
jgi:aminomethyltransferase